MAQVRHDPGAVTRPRRGGAGRRRGRRAAAALGATGAAALALLAAAACGDDPDLTRAIDGGVGRRPSRMPPPVAAHWTEVETDAAGERLLARPTSLCWAGGTLVVADQALARLAMFDTLGRLTRVVPGARDRAPRLVQPSAVACAPGGAGLLVADAGAERVYLLHADGRPRAAVPAPPTPQRVPLLGAFALAPDGRWFDSWLGTTEERGPYLSDDDWRRVTLVRTWDPTGVLTRQFGSPTHYRNTVARRVFNRTFVAYHRDTLWAMTQADALVRGFDRDGRAVPLRVWLPVYYRGRDPWISVGPPLHPSTALRNNWLAYQPNVGGGLVVVEDSLFAVVRYRDWRIAFRGALSSGSFDYWAESAVEVIDRRGVVRRSLAVPGKVVALSSDAGARLAVITEEQDRRYRVLIGAAGGRPVAAR